MSSSGSQNGSRTKERRRRRSPRRCRKVWIKARPLSNLPKTVEDREKVADLYSELRWLHWALEVGPWTLELAMEAKGSSKMIVRRVHHSLCDEDWESEVDRVQIGDTRMRDEEIDEVEEGLAHRCTIAEYDMSGKLGGWNCQSVASIFAMHVCDADPSDTWDSLENMAFFARDSLLVPLVELTVTSSGVSSMWDPRVLLRMKKIYFPSQRPQDVEPKNREETLRATRINVVNDVLNISDMFKHWITVRRDMWR